MRNKILFRLVIYFVTSFIIFALIIGITFSDLFSKHNIDLRKAELESHSISAARILSEMIEGSTEYGRGRHGMNCMGTMNFNAYLQLIEELVKCSIWIVDQNFEQVALSNRHRHMQSSFNPEDLPNHAEQIIEDAFGGIVSTSESFGEFFGTPSITVAAPITLGNGSIVGVILLHSYVSDIEIVTSRGLTLLMYSMIIGVLVSAFIAILFSSRFTKPLNKMKNAALQIGNGDYSIKTGVTQSDEIGELAVVLDEMARKLELSSKESEKLEKMRRDFVANISHELRTPITVIRGSLEAIHDGVVDNKEKIEEYHEQILNETIYLDRLVTDLLDLACLQNPDFAIKMNFINLRDIAYDVIQSMKGIARRKNLNINFSIGNEDFLFMGDYGRIRQMLIIILDNAVKFSEIGGSVEIILSRSANDIVLTIQDDGHGIDADDLPYIFERFYKQRSEQNKTGTGLGLPIAKQIADRHGISIDVTSHKLNGTKFIFIFPNTLDL